MVFCRYDGSKIARRLCNTDLYCFIANFLFIIIFLIGCAYIVFQNRKKKFSDVWRSKYHSLRYSIILFLIYVHLLELVEGILSDVGFSGGEPHLYLSPGASLVCTLLSLIFYDKIESAKTRKYLLILLIYWPITIILYSLRLFALIQLGLNFQSVRYTLTSVVILIRCQLAVLEGALLVNDRYLCNNHKKKKMLHKKIKGFSHYYANFLSQMTWQWLSRLLVLGYKTNLKVEDLGELNELEKSNYNSNKIEKEVSKQTCKNTGKFSLWKVIFKCHWKLMLFGGTIKILSDLLLFFNPFILDRVVLHVSVYTANKKFLGNYSDSIPIAYDRKYSEFYDNITDFLKDHKPTMSPIYPTWQELLRNGFFLAVCGFGLQLLQNILWQNSFFYSVREGIRCKTSLQALIYKKSLCLTLFSMNDEMFAGRVLNHMSLDTHHMYMLFYMFNFTWTIPIQVGTTIFLLYCQLGVSAIIGAIALILILPIQIALASLLSRFQKRAMEFTDKRIKQCNELFQSIKLLKLYAWELVFRDKMEKTRNMELKMILKAACLRALSIVVTECIPVIAIMITFLTYHWIEGKTLTANKVFSGVALFNILLIPLLVVSLAVNALSHARVSCRRMNSFLEMDEVKNVSGHFEKGEKINTVLEISSGNFCWNNSAKNKTDQEINLKNINLSIEEGSLTVIAGPVGSGKSSLLAAILGEMNLASGTLKRKSDVKIAFGSQRAWLLNTTLKENITFGQPWVKEKYEKVIDASALTHDIEILPGGDSTEIGERGINVSGGQKQRISIARTLYADADVIVLDDPMSALDVHVGRHIFEEAIYNYLIKELNRTVILVTHQVQYLPKADKVIAMDRGKIVAQGTYDEICDNFPHLVKSWEEPETGKFFDSKKLKSRNNSEIDINRGINLFPNNLTRSSSIVSLPLSGIALDNFDESQNIPLSKQNEIDKGEDETGKLIDGEEMETGSISWKVYKKFILAASIRFSLSTILAYFIRQSLRIGSDFWLAHWSESSRELSRSNLTSKDDQSSHQSWMMIIYSCICFSFVTCSIISSLLIEYTCLRGSKRLHSSMLHRIVDAPMRFFDTTPTGRIVNRFTGDILVLDERLAQVLDELFYCSFFSLGGVIVNAISSYYFLVAAIPLVAIYLTIQRFYIPSCRDLQRLNSITKSPVLSHFGETLGGLSTIRAYHRQKAFLRKNYEVVDVNNNAFFNLQATILWMGIRLDFVGSLTVFASIICVLSSGLSGVASEGVVGLSIAYALMISLSLNWMMKAISETEMTFNAVERISHYTNIKIEPFDSKQEIDETWPSEGNINMKDLYLRYDESLDDVIKNLSLSIQGAEKVGICGRTGSGKSSLMLGLFRLVDKSEGQIEIDGRDIANVPLRLLRSHLSIIPQDPVLFAGSVRFNLDPVELYTDEEIWKALEIAQLVPIIKSKPELLNSTVAEGGENFSLGQRQLFCLARALLRNSKILIMDEATASVDMITDKIVQKVINHHFKDKTILTIAHRVSSILNYDTIVVLKNGSIIEKGSPSELKSKIDSIFSNMIRDNL